MGFFEAVKTCFQKYAVFSGRARRSEFWYFMLFIAIINLILGFVGNDWGSNIFSLAILLPSIAVTCRRLHDTGRSGWWQAPYLAAYGISAIALVYVLTTVGTGSGSMEDFVVQMIENLSETAALVAIFTGIWIIAAIVGIIVVIFCIFRSHGDNQYGPSPLANAQAAGGDTGMTHTTERDNTMSSDGDEHKRMSDVGDSGNGD